MRGQPQRGLVQRNQTCSHLDPGFLSSRIMTEKSLFKPQKEGPDQELNQPSSTNAPAPTVLNPPPRGLHSQQDSKHRPGVQQNVCAQQYFKQMLQTPQVAEGVTEIHNGIKSNTSGFPVTGDSQYPPPEWLLCETFQHYSSLPLSLLKNSFPYHQLEVKISTSHITF